MNSLLISPRCPVAHPSPRIAGAALLASIALAGTIAAAEPAGGSANAESAWSLGVEAGTLGYGPKLEFAASPKWRFELGYTFLDYDDDYEDEDTTYTGELGLSNVQALLNWHPGGGAFHLSAGAIFGDNTVDLVGVANPGTVYEIGDATYTGEEVGTLNGHVDVTKSVSPYVGLGWTKSPQNSGFGFFLNVGAMFSGSAQVDLSATGPIATDATFQANLREEEQNVQDDLDQFKIYPVLQLGLIWRF